MSTRRTRDGAEHDATRDAVWDHGLWQDLLPVGRDPRTGGYHRLAWTGTDALLREWFVGAATARGLDVTTDRAGNLWAWWGDPDAAAAAGRPGVVVGSHLDSVRDGGAFDGPLGVVTALAAVAALRARGVVPARPVGVACFADEEGARFGVACAGSRLLTGALDPDRARGLRDEDGTTLAEAHRAAGNDPGGLGADRAALARVGAFVELHVEQGRGLVDLDRPVGVGTGIDPHGRWRVHVTGTADHAGTTRLADRDDALLRAAGVVLDARSAAARHGCVATVGSLRVQPGSANAVPSGVDLWLDARGPDETAVRAVVADATSTVGRSAGDAVHEESWTARTSFDPALTARVARLLDDAPLLGTAAGHDAGVLAGAGVPTTMLFVRNPTGVSHSPAEHAEQADCAAGATALVRVLTDLVAVDGTPA